MQVADCKKLGSCKLGLLQEVGVSLSAHAISPELIMNIDWTLLNFFLTSSHTLALKGSKNGPITSSTDYRQITWIFSIAMSGEFLPI